MNICVTCIVSGAISGCRARKRSCRSAHRTVELDSEVTSSPGPWKDLKITVDPPYEL